MAAPFTPSTAGPLPDDILLVEDNFIIALDLADMLRQLGIASVRSANSVVQALDLITEQLPQFAFVDVNLGSEKSFAVAERLNELAIPFAFATGYGDNDAFPSHFANTPIVVKPYTMEAIRRAISLPPEDAGSAPPETQPPEPEPAE